MKTRAPSSMKRFAAARPMPVAPPVMTATFPSSFPIVTPFGACLAFSTVIDSKVREATSPGSDLRHASIDGEIHAGDVGTFIGSKEHDCRRDFLGHAPATHWDLRGELCGRLLGLFSRKARRGR